MLLILLIFALAALSGTNFVEPLQNLTILPASSVVAYDPEQLAELKNDTTLRKRLAMFSSRVLPEQPEARGCLGAGTGAAYHSGFFGTLHVQPGLCCFRAGQMPESRSN
jgi:hypothetical protein